MWLPLNYLVLTSVIRGHLSPTSCTSELWDCQWIQWAFWLQVIQIRSHWRCLTEAICPYNDAVWGLQNCHFQTERDIIFYVYSLWSKHGKFISLLDPEIWQVIASMALIHDTNIILQVSTMGPALCQKVWINYYFINFGHSCAWLYANIASNINIFIWFLYSK